jgi:hypothetical protein
MYAEALTWFGILGVMALYLRSQQPRVTHVTAPLKNYDEVEAKRYAHDGSQPTSYRVGNRPEEKDREVLALRTALGYA